MHLCALDLTVSLILESQQDLHHSSPYSYTRVLLAACKCVPQHERLLPWMMGACF